ncbi:MAG: sigma-70 family RNA polymerase sigma factor [Lachnospiraceae bacterium]|nr:sigma-70 family RNA polymerase sigma factor [Lachnospiraceae bacterium]
MNHSLDGTNKEEQFARDYEVYVNDIYRLCFSFLKNQMDAEDAVQETFIKFYRCRNIFCTEEHKKAWLVVAASNHCKDVLKHWWRKRIEFDSGEEIVGESKDMVDEMLELVMQLPDKYKTAVYLYYYEGYDSKQIAKLLNKPDSTIRTYLQKARKMLKKEWIVSEGSK